MASDLDPDCRLQLRECRELALYSAGISTVLWEPAAGTGFPSPCAQIGEYFQLVHEDYFERGEITHRMYLELFESTWGTSQAYDLRVIQMWAKDAYQAVLVWWGCFSNYAKLAEVQGASKAQREEVANAVGQYASQLMRLDRLIGRLRAAIRRGELSHS